MKRLHIEVTNTLTEIPPLAERVEAFGEAAGLDPATLFKLNLCLDELLTNTISYGYDAADGSQPITLTLTLGSGILRVVLEDGGRPFDPFSEAPEPDLEAELDERAIGGLGVFLVKEFMDEATYRHEHGRNRVELTKRVNLNEEDA